MAAKKAKKMPPWLAKKGEKGGMKGKPEMAEKDEKVMHGPKKGGMKGKSSNRKKRNVGRA